MISALNDKYLIEKTVAWLEEAYAVTEQAGGIRNAVISNLSTEAIATMVHNDIFLVYRGTPNDRTNSR